jgi:uncharacterized delta-60 repeat protein
MPWLRSLRRNDLLMRTSLLCIFALMALVSAILQAQPGTLDTSFGVNGLVTTVVVDNERNDNLTAVQVQPDGRIVVAGYVLYPDFMSRPVLIRYLPDGTLDGSFGSGGIVHPTSGSSIQLYDLRILPDGKLLVCGAISPTSSTQQQDCYIARYNTDGTLDASFGNGGSVVQALSTGTDYILRIVVLPDGRYQALGRSGSGSAGTSFLMMFESSGTLDNGFSGDGRLFDLFAAAAPQGVSDLAVRADGSVLALGGGAGEVKVVAVQNNGSLNSGFGNGGTVVVSAGSSLHVLPGGNILVHGLLTTGAVPTLRSTRLLPSGGIDATYGSGGTFSFTDPALTAISSLGKPLFYPDGRYMIGWRYHYPITNEVDVAITWFDANGGVSAVGTEVTDLGPLDSDQDQVMALAMAPDGDILAACGYIDNFRRLVVARYNGDLLTNGIAPERQALPISAFPVPASTEMRLSLPGVAVITGVSLLDGAGQRVPVPVFIRGGVASVDVQQLASGVYIAEVMAEGRVHHHRVQVLR